MKHYTKDQVEQAIAEGVNPRLQHLVDTRKKLMNEHADVYLRTKDVQAKIAWIDEVICSNPI